jgi:hypothetical protein
VFDKINRFLFNRKYIEVANFIKGIDKRCTKKTNLYVGINNLSEFEVATLLKEAYGLKVPVGRIKEKIYELNNSPFSNKMINVNMFHHKEDYIKYGDLGSVIIGNNFRSGIHHTIEFDYIDTISVNGKIVIKD